MSQHDAPDAEWSEADHLARLACEWSDRALELERKLFAVSQELAAARADLARVAALVQAAERWATAHQARLDASIAATADYDARKGDAVGGPYFHDVERAWDVEDVAAERLMAILAQQEAT